MDGVLLQDGRGDLRQKGEYCIMRHCTVKEYYTEALFQLLERKPMEAITVSDLVKRSGASRASFYRNYSSKEQIVEEYLEKVFGDIFLRHPLDGENRRQELCELFREIYRHRKTLTVLKKAGQLDKIDNIIYDDTLAQIRQIGVLNNKYQPYYFAGAASAFIKAWVDFDFAESPEEITELFVKSLAGYMLF